MKTLTYFAIHSPCQFNIVKLKKSTNQLHRLHLRHKPRFCLPYLNNWSHCLITQAADFCPANQIDILMMILRTSSMIHTSFWHSSEGQKARHVLIETHDAFKSLCDTETQDIYDELRRKWSYPRLEPNMSSDYRGKLPGQSSKDENFPDRKSCLKRPSTLASTRHVKWPDKTFPPLVNLRDAKKDSNPHLARSSVGHTHDTFQKKNRVWSIPHLRTDISHTKFNESSKIVEAESTWATALPQKGETRVVREPPPDSYYIDPTFQPQIAPGDIQTE